MGLKFLLLIPLFLIGIVECREQCLAVSGRISCPTGGRSKAYVRLVDVDRAGRDDEMAAACVTNENFHIRGCGSDAVGQIDPLLKIYHNCGGGQPKVFDVTIPADSVTTGSYNHRGVIDLSRHEDRTDAGRSYAQKLEECAAFSISGGGSSTGGGGHQHGGRDRDRETGGHGGGGGGRGHRRMRITIDEDDEE